MQQRKSYRVGLIGEGIRSSLTPAMHMREGAHLGFDYTYELFDIAAGALDEDRDLAGFVKGLGASGFSGVNVTHPFKQRILPLLDEVSEDAERIGAVNLVVFTEGRTTGYNTDWTGFRSSIRMQLEGGQVGRVLQLGAGGAGAATSYALLSMGAEEVVVCDLEASRAIGLAERYRQFFPRQRVSAAGILSEEILSRVDGVVHATPLGMGTHPGMPFDPGLLGEEAWVAEVVYRPLETELVVSSREKGRRIIDGGMMAAGQAIDSLRILTGVEPDQKRVHSHLLAMLEDERRLAPV